MHLLTVELSAIVTVFDVHSIPLTEGDGLPVQGIRSRNSEVQLRVL